jgi:hypothetical protein
MTVEINQLQPDVWEHRVFTTAHPTAVFDYIAEFNKHVEWGASTADGATAQPSDEHRRRPVPQDL